MAVSRTAAPVERTTVLAAKEKAKLIKSLRRFDMVFFTVCALQGRDMTTWYAEAMHARPLRES
jgi:hypothetical protein